MALILDTGPLLATLDDSDRLHRVSASLLRAAREQIVIPAPVLVEIDYWIQQRLRPEVMALLLDDIADGVYALADLDADDYRRIRELLTVYSDARVGFVDAAVMAVVERLGEHKLATLDRRHFSLMRPRHVAAIELLPA
jgi:predicted nucleic acid-binding protein